MESGYGTMEVSSKDRRMELGKCISRLIHQDNRLTSIIITWGCLEDCLRHSPDESDDVDSIEAEENSINNCISILIIKAVPGSGSLTWVS
jgi:hypothetical protein